MSDPLQGVLRADKPLTLASVPTGFLPWLAADLARAAHGSSKGCRAVAIVADEAAMRALVETVPLFAPEVDVLPLPGWDCLPYDRASPALRVMAERLASLSALQAKRDEPQLLVATASAATQRLLTPFRIRQLTRRIAEGEQVEREALVQQLNALGYQRSDTVAEHGEYAVRGSLIAIALVALTGALAFGSIGLLVGSRVKTLEAISGLMNLIMVPMWVLSGVFFSSSNFPEVVQPFIRELPLTALVDALRGVVLEGDTLGGIRLELATLAAWAIVPFSIGLRIFKWR